MIATKGVDMLVHIVDVFDEGHLWRGVNDRVCRRERQLWIVNQNIYCKYSMYFI